jgi:hypothetical protein
MNSKIIWGFLGAMIVIGTILFIYLGSSQGKRTLNLEETKAEVLNEVEEAENYAEETSEWMEKNGVEEIGFFNPPHNEEPQEKSELKLEVVKYFVAGLLDNNIDIFLSSFYPESISKDLFKQKNPDKYVVAQEIIDRISRKETIENIEYKVNKGFMDRETNAFTLTIIYKDKQKADITLEVMPVEDVHSEEEVHQMYVITNSVWDMIEQIENSTK